VSDPEIGESGGETTEPAAPEDTTSTSEDVSPFAALEAERDKLKDQLLRMAADFDNFRKRTRKDLEQVDKRAREETLRELLPIFDNLERAAQAAEGAAGVESIREGVRMVLRLWEDNSIRVGLTRIVAIGERFDPMLHEALQQKDTDEHPPGTIVAEIQAGYRLGDRLVRPAMVVVARKPKDETAT
jgi:molecular chaperone GrpE